jgi:hypothetical protein
VDLHEEDVVRAEASILAAGSQDEVFASRDTL